MTRRRDALVFVLKVIVAAVLITVLVRRGALDWRAVGAIARSPKLLAANVVEWIACSVVLGVIRWSLLLRLADVTIPVGRATALQLMAFFFNVVIPGNVGGDVLKTLYVARDEPAHKRPTLLLIVLIERLVGIAGLVGVALVALSAHARNVWAVPAFRPMVLTTIALGVAFIVLPALGVLVVQRWGEAVERRVEGATRLARVASQLVKSARLVAAKPWLLVFSVVVSMAVHGGAMALFTLFARGLTGQDVSMSQIATVFPLGMLSVVLPVSPAGFGVGHLAFERLFAVVGLTGGATVFNVYLLGQILPCLSGAVPYLMMRTELAVTAAAPRDP